MRIPLRLPPHLNIGVGIVTSVYAPSAPSMSHAQIRLRPSFDQRNPNAARLAVSLPGCVVSRESSTVRSQNQPEMCLVTASRVDMRREPSPPIRL